MIKISKKLTTLLDSNLFEDKAHLNPRDMPLFQSRVHYLQTLEKRNEAIKSLLPFVGKLCSSGFLTVAMGDTQEHTIQAMRCNNGIILELGSLALPQSPQLEKEWKGLRLVKS